MFDIIPWITGAAMSGAGQIFNYNQQRENNQLSIEQADKQMQFQENMSNTAHQREVKDLTAAGLNPILSAGGNGSSTPSGAQGSVTAPKVELPDMLSYGLSVRQLEQADQKLAIEKANSAANIAKTLSDADLLKMKKILAQKGMLKANLEGEASSILQQFIKMLKDAPRKVPQFKPAKPGTFDGSGNLMP